MKNSLALSGAFEATMFTKAIWDAAMGKELPCEREPANLADVCAVAVIEDGQCVGHISQKISRVCSLFIQGEELLVVR